MMKMSGLTLAVVLTLTTLAVADGNTTEPSTQATTDQSTAVAESNNRFALNLFAQLRNQPGNLFFSPFSISTALAMTSLGARGETATQMYGVLGFKPDQSEKMHGGYAELLTRLNGDPKERGYQLSVANALWGQREYGFRPEFIATSKKHYGAGLNEVDYIHATEAARKTINAWVEKRTQEKIKELIKPRMVDTDTRLVLANAIYFKGNWASQFKKEATREEAFFVSADNKINVPMMHQSRRYRYAEDGQIQLLELPYVKEELSMVVLLPKQPDGLAKMEETLTPDSLTNLLAKMHETKVDVTLPKFTTTTEFKLNDTLIRMGMPLAFSGGANFSGMAEKERLFISAVVHQAFVDVNEEGTEAAAATGVVMNRIGLITEPELVPVFRADHPFLFFVRDTKSGATLFLGRVVNPVAGS